MRAAMCNLATQQEPQGGAAELTCSEPVRVVKRRGIKQVKLYKLSRGNQKSFNRRCAVKADIFCFAVAPSKGTEHDNSADWQKQK